VACLFIDVPIIRSELHTSRAIWAGKSKMSARAFKFFRTPRGEDLESEMSSSMDANAASRPRLAAGDCRYLFLYTLLRVSTTCCVQSASSACVTSSCQSEVQRVLRAVKAKRSVYCCTTYYLTSCTLTMALLLFLSC
jgi:hypothetical protein